MPHIDITMEDLTVERVQYNPDPVLGSCDVCKQGRASWEVDYGWNRTFPYQVPQLMTHAFICDRCHQAEKDTLKFIRAFLERQANYVADHLKERQVHEQTRSENGRHQESRSAGESLPSLRKQSTPGQMPEAPGR